MSFPTHRPRRLRESEAIRDLVAETHVSLDDLVLPMFVVPGSNVKEPISTLPGHSHLSVDELVEEAKRARDAGVRAVILFGLPEIKDDRGTAAFAPEGTVQTALRELRSDVSDLLLMTDICLCQYTSHGHCGVVKDGRVLNDPTLELLSKTAVSHAEAGAHVVAPSDMMDGRIGAIRSALDHADCSHVSILSYSVKYASAFYGPFRAAAHSAPDFGDRRTYQMAPPNRREAIREASLDIEEGADIVMVKPAMPYLDVLRDLREHTNVPLAAYQVSGEFAALKAAAERDWLDGRSTAIESLLAIKRAGASIILSYFTKELAPHLQT